MKEKDDFRIIAMACRINSSFGNFSVSRRGGFALVLFDVTCKEVMNCR